MLGYSGLVLFGLLGFPGMDLELFDWLNEVVKGLTSWTPRCAKNGVLNGTLGTGVPGLCTGGFSHSSDEFLRVHVHSLRCTIGSLLHMVMGSLMFG